MLKPQNENWVDSNGNIITDFPETLCFCVRIVNKPYFEQVERLLIDNREVRQYLEAYCVRNNVFFENVQELLNFKEVDTSFLKGAYDAEI